MPSAVTARSSSAVSSFAAMRGERQQDVVDELRDERLHLEVVRDAAEEAAADAVRVQVDEAGRDQAVLVADHLLSGAGASRVTASMSEPST